MITSMTGLIYLSGKICYADELNMDLLKESVAVYKSYRGIINTAVPTYVLPMKHITDKSYNAYGLLDSESGDLLLAVWNLESVRFELDLKKYGYSKAELIYPSSLGGVEWAFDKEKTRFEFSKNYSARLFRLKK